MSDLEKWKKYFSQDRFAAYCGIELLEISPGFARAQLKISEHHLNAVSLVQGGAIFTLADFAFAAASNSHGVVTVGMQTSITFHNATRRETLIATAHEISRGRTTSSYEVIVEDSSQLRVATFFGLGYIKKEIIFDRISQTITSAD